VTWRLNTGTVELVKAVVARRRRGTRVPIDTNTQQTSPRSSNSTEAVFSMWSASELYVCVWRLVRRKQSLRVEAGKNTSTVIPASRKRRRKGNLVVSDNIVMYGHESSATLTTDRLHHKLQTRLLVREGAPRCRANQFSSKIKKKVKSGHWAPKGCPIPKHID
jgi:hypothetical protein